MLSHVTISRGRVLLLLLSLFSSLLPLLLSHTPLQSIVCISLSHRRKSLNLALHTNFETNGKNALVSEPLHLPFSVRGQGALQYLPKQGSTSVCFSALFFTLVSLLLSTLPSR